MRIYATFLNHECGNHGALLFRHKIDSWLYFNFSFQFQLVCLVVCANDPQSDCIQYRFLLILNPSHILYKSKLDNRVRVYPSNKSHVTDKQSVCTVHNIEVFNTCMVHTQLHTPAPRVYGRIYLCNGIIVCFWVHRAVYLEQ